MEVILARSAGFCFGVRRAVDTVYEQAQHGAGKIYTFGPIIHNEEVVKDLEEKGVQVVENTERLRECGDGTVIIRSHGVGKAVYELLKEERIAYVDATCPFVRKIHRIVESYSDQGFHVVIIGNENHPEVEGIKGWSSNERETSVISTAEEAQNFVLKREKKACIVSQTTFNYNKFQHIVEMIHPVLLVIKIMRDQRPHISGSCFPTVIPVMISPRNAIIHVNLRMIEKHFHRFFQKQMSVKPIVIHRKTIYTIFFCDFALPLQSLHI